MSNHLIHENSPYLLQHAENPVDWFPWGPEALEKARAEDKPIFLSIGYAACHWCHVMAHESFEEPSTAAFMNQFFVNIKVDREERPDLDSIYMQAVVAMTGQGGWPMSVFLAPDGKPFYGGTYFPPAPRYGMPSFQELLQTIARLWQEDRASLLKSGAEIAAHLEQTTQSGQDGAAGAEATLAEDTLAEATLSQASMSLAQGYDWKSGGWGRAPKFPQPMTIEYLLRRSTRGDSLALDMAVHALKAMAKGGMYDVVGGGFARYSTDDRWCIPHFEKMLYDNAQLATAYLHAWLESGDESFRRVCQETLDFVLREMTHPLGGFYSSLDADSGHKEHGLAEGAFYVWMPQEIRLALGNGQEADFAIAAYGVTEAGNFEGKNVLQRALSDEQLAVRFGLPAADVPERLKGLHARLLAARSQRARPGTDDKILTGWNALMLAAFAEAGRYLGRADYRAAAQRNAHFLLDHLYQGDRLMRSWRARHNAYLEDYAALILGLLALYQTDADVAWYAAASRLADEMIAHFADPGDADAYAGDADAYAGDAGAYAGGFFDTRDDHESLLYRPKDVQDNATPSGNALAALALLQLSAYGDLPEGRHRAEAMLGSMQDLMARHPTAFAQWLCAADFALGEEVEVAILGEAGHPQMEALLQALWHTYRPRQVTAASGYPPALGSPPLLNDRPLKDGLPTAYVCRGFVCRLPTNSPQEMAAQMEEVV